MDWDKQQELNRQHLLNPQEGDYWHEMSCPYFIIAAVDEDGVLVFDTTYEVDKGHFSFRSDKIKYMTREELRKSLTYKTMPDKFVAMVIPKKGGK